MATQFDTQRLPDLSKNVSTILASEWDLAFRRRNGKRLLSVVNADSPYTLSAWECDAVLADCAGGAITINLPPSPGATIIGWCILVKAKNITATSVTVDSQAGNTIDGSQTYVMSTSDDWVEIMWDGTEWSIINTN